MKNLLIFSVLILLLSSCTWNNDTATQWDINNILEEEINAEAVITEEILTELDTEITIKEENTWTYEKFSYSTISGESVDIYPIDHASAVVEWNNMTIFADPTEAVEWFNSPDIIFVSHEHGDHFNKQYLWENLNEWTTFITTQEVFSQLDEELQQYTTVMKNGDSIEMKWFTISAVAAYNIREEALGFHPKGQWNGYIFERDDFRVYFSGDTEDTPEMRALENIDVAFVSMNLPYTMPVESAADAIIEFAPKTIFPYHYRGKAWKSDIELFKTLVQKENPDINVEFWKWYAE